MQNTSGSRTASATSSSAARSTRRSSHSTISRLMLAEAVLGRPQLVLQSLGDHRVDVEVNGANRVRVERVAVEQGALGRQVVVVDEDDDAVHANVHARPCALLASKACSSRTYCSVKANQPVVHERTHHRR